MVQEATIAPITLLPSEVRAALPHTLCQQLLQCFQGQSSLVVGLGLAWLLWGGGPGLPLERTVAPPLHPTHDGRRPASNGMAQWH